MGERVNTAEDQPSSTHSTNSQRSTFSYVEHMAREIMPQSSTNSINLRQICFALREGVQSRLAITGESSASIEVDDSTWMAAGDYPLVDLPLQPRGNEEQVEYLTDGRLTELI